MNVYLKADGELIPAEWIVRWVSRSVLAPIPRTMEITFRNTGGLAGKIVEGAKLWTGREHLKYHIVKVVTPEASGLIQGDEHLSVITATAMLDSCIKVGYRTDRAIVRENATFGEVFRASGAEISIQDDFTVARFSCLKGMIPSFHLAQSLQEEAGTLVLRDGKISFVRLIDIFKQQPKDLIVQADAAAGVESEFLERHEIPSYFSLDDAGEFVQGDTSVTRGVIYHPRTERRELHNMSRVLVLRKIAPAAMAQSVVAGDAIRVGDETLAVMNAVHVFETSEANGQINSYSRFWLGGLS